MYTLGLHAACNAQYLSQVARTLCQVLQLSHLLWSQINGRGGAHCGPPPSIDNADKEVTTSYDLQLHVRVEFGASHVLSESC